MDKIYNAEEYENLLKNMDWNYEFSDDHTVWKRGSNNMKLIRAYQPIFDSTKTLLNKYQPK